MQGSFSQQSSKYLMAPAVRRESTDETITFQHQDIPLQVIFDSGAQASFVGANSKLGRLLATYPKVSLEAEWVVAPVCAGGRFRFRVLWSVRTELQAEYQDPQGKRIMKTLPILMNGIDGMEGETVFIGDPALEEWGAITDTRTRRVGIRMLKSDGEPGTPWFKEPSIRNNGWAKNPPTNNRWTSKPQQFNAEGRHLIRPRSPHKSQNQRSKKEYCTRGAI